MGNQQPKKISKVTKTQIDIGALKAKIHLQLMRDRKNAEVIKAEKQLINKIKSKSRNRTEQILVAERVVNGLKYAQACNQLMSYAISIRSQANFLAENLLFPEKLVPWLPQIYSLIYAADTLGLSSLKEFKDLMRALNDPVIVNKYIKPQIIDLLKPTPSPFELNIYILEFSERNNIPLQEINLPGHKFSKDLPSPQDQPSMKDDSFYDLQKKLADELQNKLKTNDNSNQNKGGPNGNGNNSGNNGGFGGSNSGNGGFGGNGGFNGNNGGFGGSSSGNGGLGGNNGYGGNNGGFGGNNGGFGGNGGNTGIPGWGGQGGNNGGFGGNNGGFGGNGGNTGIPGWGGQGGNNGGLGGNQNPGYYDFDKKPADKSSQSSNPYGIRDTYDPKANLANITNPLPQFYDNTIKSNPQNGKKPAQMTDSRMSINSIEQIDYYPQIEPPKAPKVIPDPDFDRICQILRAAM